MVFGPENQKRSGTTGGFLLKQALHKVNDPPLPEKDRRTLSLTLLDLPFDHAFKCPAIAQERLDTDGAFTVALLQQYQKFPLRLICFALACSRPLKWGVESFREPKDLRLEQSAHKWQKLGILGKQMIEIPQIESACPKYIRGGLFYSGPRHNGVAVVENARDENGAPANSLMWEVTQDPYSSPITATKTSFRTAATAWVKHGEWKGI